MSKGDSVESYVLSQTAYLLSEISRNQQLRLPLPCTVQEGYYGESCWDTVSSGEVLLLNRLERRLRALACDSDRSRFYSIPLNYPAKFFVIRDGKKDGLPMLINDIVKNHQLPVTLKLDQQNLRLTSSKDLKGHVHLENIKIERTYEEKYFIGNVINQNGPLNEVIRLPTFLKVRIRTVDGLIGRSTEEWKRMLNRWVSEGKKLQATAILPPIDIVVFSSIPTVEESTQSQDIYDTLEPTTYVKLDFSQPETHLYTALTTTTSAKDRLQNYDNPAEKKPAISGVEDFTAELKETISHRTASHSPIIPKRQMPKSNVPDRPHLPSPTSTARTFPEKGPYIELPHSPPIPPTSKSAEPTTALANRKRVPTPPPAFADFDTTIDPDYVIEPRNNSQISSLKDIPPSIKCLNCEEVADCLRLLKMSMYIDAFLENQVNGKFLMELDETFLQTQLQLSPLHAKKLVLFAQTGWRP